MQAEIHEIDFRSELPMKNINTNIKMNYDIHFRGKGGR